MFVSTRQHTKCFSVVVVSVSINVLGACSLTTVLPRDLSKSSDPLSPNASAREGFFVRLKIQILQQSSLQRNLLTHALLCPSIIFFW